MHEANKQLAAATFFPHLMLVGRVRDAQFMSETWCNEAQSEMRTHAFASGVLRVVCTCIAKGARKHEAREDWTAGWGWPLALAGTVECMFGCGVVAASVDIYQRYRRVLGG